MEKKPRAFILMPFDSEFDSIYDTLIKQSLQEAGYEVTRADSLLDQRNILREIVVGITDADLIVADLTTNNPNVFYELGLSHGLGRATVLLAQSISDVPFDLRSYKIHIYETHFNKIKKLKDFLKAVGEKHLKKEISFGNPVKDFSALSDVSRGNQRPALSTKTSERELDDNDGKGLLDFWVEGERATQDLTAILNSLLKDNQLLTKRISQHTTNMEALSNNPTAGSAGRFHKIALLASSDMNSFSKKVEDVLPRFEGTIEKLNQNYSGYISLINPTTEEDRKGIIHLGGMLETLLETSRESSRSIHVFRESSIRLGEQKISKDLTRASRRQAEALNGIIANVERVEAFAAKTLAMLREKQPTDLSG